MPAFSELVDEFLAREFELAPVQASGLGLTDYDDRLDDLSDTTFHARDEHASTWLARFQGLACGELDKDELLDGICERVMGDFEFPELTGDWAQDCRAGARAWRRLMQKHPEVIEQQRDTVTAPGQHRGMNTPQPQ